MEGNSYFTYTRSFKLIAPMSLDKSKNKYYQEATPTLALAAYPTPTENRVLDHLFTKMTAKDGPAN